MIYIDFNIGTNANYLSLLSTLQSKDIISIPPKRDSLNEYTSISDFKYYQGYSKTEIDNFQKKLWVNLQKWIKINCPNISTDVIKYCSLNLSIHFSLNYISTFNIIQNLICSGKYSEYTIICSDEMLTIDSDWCCSFISLLACVEAFDNANVKYFLLETNTGVLNSLICENSLIYLPSIFDNIQKEDNHIIFKEKIIKYKYISYQLTNRFNFFTNEADSLCITPKSIINNSYSIGAYLQFPPNTLESVSYDSWQEFNLMINSFAKKLESNFFNSIGYYLFPKILSSIKNLSDILFNPNDPKYLILEEIVDLEAIPIISLFYNNQNIYLTQHSSGPIIVSQENSNNKSIASKIFTNSNYSQNEYTKILPEVEVLRNPLTIYNSGSSPIFAYKNTIVIIENDFFRKFGIPFNIELIYNDISTFLKVLIEEECEFKILWKQRTNDFNLIFELIKNKFPDIIFVFDSSLSIDNISSISNISIGFGQNSSFATQLLTKGVINYFGSAHYLDNEYVPNVDLFHQLIGPENSARLIAKSIKNIDSAYCHTLNRQRRILELI